MTDQELFDKVAKHLLTQNCKSIVRGVCTYRSPDGLKCAAGCLIEDDEYNPKFENQVVGKNNDVTQLFKNKGYNVNLIRELQRIHDMNSPSVWGDELIYLAQHRNLNTKVIDDFGLEKSIPKNT